MSSQKLIQEWWLEPEQGDASLEDEHQEFWQDVVENVIDRSLTQKRVLDFGCNRGGLLKKLHEHYSLEKGVGVDLAQESIKVANSRVNNEPLEYHALTDLSQFNEEFDVALSTAVIYLIQDIQDHAHQMFRALKSGGVYYATHPDYTQSKGGALLMQEIKKFSATDVATNTLDDISNAFEEAGFQVYVKRLRPASYFAHTKNSSWYASIYDRIQHEYAERYVFKLVKP